MKMKRKVLSPTKTRSQERRYATKDEKVAINATNDCEDDVPIDQEGLTREDDDEA